MKAPTDDRTRFDDHGPDHWIRTGRAPPPLRQAQGQGHQPKVPLAGGHRFLRAARDRRLAVVPADFIDRDREETDSPEAFFASALVRAACAAASLAIATR